MCLHLLNISRLESQRLSTEFSKNIRELKEQNIPYNLRWTILKYAEPYRGGIYASQKKFVFSIADIKIYLIVYLIKLLLTIFSSTI